MKCLTDFSGLEEDILSDDPEQEGPGLHLRKAAKERRGIRFP
jgi:hypothetical protein